MNFFLPVVSGLPGFLCIFAEYCAVSDTLDLFCFFWFMLHLYLSKYHHIVTKYCTRTGDDFPFDEGTVASASL